MSNKIFRKKHENEEDLSEILESYQGRGDLRRETWITKRREPQRYNLVIVTYFFFHCEVFADQQLAAQKLRN